MVPPPPRYAAEPPLTTRLRRRQRPSPAVRAVRVARRALVALAVIVIVAIVAVGTTLVWALHDVPLLAAPQEPQAFPIVFEAADGKPFARKGTVRAADAKREDYPAVLVNAVTSIEDRRFFHHWGVDPYAVLRAAHTNLSAGTIVQGGSTI